LLKPLKNDRDLSLAYTPGVAEVCRLIEKRPGQCIHPYRKGKYCRCRYDGTAVLGLGDIGALASIPVMEGKAVLFKAFADVDGWPVPSPG